MTPRQQKRFRKQFAAQVEEERNGKPIDPEVAARMTKPKPVEPLHQVVATVKETGEKIAVGPMVVRPVAEEFCATINRFIIDGKEKTWSDAVVVPMTPISAGVS
jgi:hypothetical protein